MPHFPFPSLLMRGKNGLDMKASLSLEFIWIIPFTQAEASNLSRTYLYFSFVSNSHPRLPGTQNQEITLSPPFSLFHHPIPIPISLAQQIQEPISPNHTQEIETRALRICEKGAREEGGEGGGICIANHRL